MGMWLRLHKIHRELNPETELRSQSCQKLQDPMQGVEFAASCGSIEYNCCDVIQLAVAHDTLGVFVFGLGLVAGALGASSTSII